MPRTYISLFSCAGIGCYGFKTNGFECIATNELLAPRIAIQKCNHKCKYESGYICGDATSPHTHKLIFDEIGKWKEKENLRQVDVIFATPPCQGMSTVNYKKTDHEQVRNSLVVEAIKIIKEINPKIFVFENVRAFMNSVCTDITGDDMLIKESIFKNLSTNYNICWKIINFKDYGVPSSRPRTIVIGTNKSLLHVSPLLLFPNRRKEIPLRNSIGTLPRLNYCEKDSTDPFHFARPFPEYMLSWIKDLKEGETAFDNPDGNKPYNIDANGNKIINKGAYMGNKYRRLIWDRPCACIATRSDVMSSQDTLHPCDNRVLSIRELMILMTIPSDFQWTDNDSSLSPTNSDEYLKENEGNIRRCIGEAVPTLIVSTIASKINKMLDYENVMSGTLTQHSPYDNEYIKLVDNGYTIDPLKAFKQISLLNSDLSTLNIYINSFKDYISYMPQLASFYSHLDSISVDVANLTESEKKFLCQEKCLCSDLGTNICINLNGNNAWQWYKPYNLRIVDQDCVFISSSKSKKNADNEMRSLFQQI